jgi:PAS domain S-box-containing protein
MRTVDENGDHFETQHRRKDGTIYDVEISTNGAEFAGQKLIFCVCRDITERKRAEEALRESEEKFSKAFHGSPESISISTLKDGRFIEVNDGFIRDKGYSRKEIIGHTSTELGLFINPDERDNITKTLKQKGRVKNLQVEYRTKSGALRTGLLSAEIITLNDEPCVILMNNDITERRRVEDALRESEEKFSRAFHGSPDSMTISTLGDGTFIEANDSYTRLTGYSREELLGHNATEFNMWADDEQRERIIRNIRQQTKMHNEELLLRTKSGEILTLLFSTEYVHIGGELNLLSVCTDITERKRAEEELRKTGARLEATNQELEAFSYSVSHDLRSPLRSIDGFSQALLEDYTEKLDETGQDYLKRLRNASQKMGELIDGTLKLSRLTRGEMQYEEVNLSELAQEITTRLQEGQPERKVKFVIAKDLTARGDVQMLRAMLENLLGNAWKFTGKSPRARIEFGLSRNGDKPAFFIKDNGAGFDAAYADKLFNAFQRLHSEAEFPGTGIGLATVRRIINRHGGTIRAEGEAGKGATFYFTLE